MKNIKQLFCGIAIGAIATVSVTALAEYVITPNSFPVKVNGSEVQLEGYNINDSTYFKLRDIADAVGGFTVDFVDNTITLRSENAPAPTPVPAPTAAPEYQTNTGAKPTPNPKLPLYRYGGDEFNPNAHIDEYNFTSDGLVIETRKNGETYVNTLDIDTVYELRSHGYDLSLSGLGVSELAVYEFDNTKSVWWGDKILDNIPTSPESTSYIPVEYYETNLRPWFQTNCK